MPARRELLLVSIPPSTVWMRPAAGDGPWAAAGSNNVSSIIHCTGNYTQVVGLLFSSSIMATFFQQYNWFGLLPPSGRGVRINLARKHPASPLQP